MARSWPHTVASTSSRITALNTVAAQTLMRIDMDSVTRHEQMLTAYALEQLRSVPGITLYGATVAGKTDDRLGVIPFNLHSLPHALVAPFLATKAASVCAAGVFARNRTCRSCWGATHRNWAPGEARVPAAPDPQGLGWCGQPRPVQHVRRRRRPRGDAEADCGRRLSGPV
jgi:selenocysteine lyase/cysteine desulfurase